MVVAAVPLASMCARWSAATSPKVLRAAVTDAILSSFRFTDGFMPEARRARASSRFALASSKRSCGEHTKGSMFSWPLNDSANAKACCRWADKQVQTVAIGELIRLVLCGRRW